MQKCIAASGADADYRRLVGPTSLPLRTHGPQTHGAVGVIGPRDVLQLRDVRSPFEGDEVVGSTTTVTTADASCEGSTSHWIWPPMRLGVPLAATTGLVTTLPGDVVGGEDVRSRGRVTGSATTSSGKVVITVEDETASRGAMRSTWRRRASRRSRRHVRRRRDRRRDGGGWPQPLAMSGRADGLVRLSRVATAAGGPG